MSRAQHHSEHGGSRIKTIMVLLIFGAMVFVLVKIVPLLVTNYEFQDKIQQEATFATVSRKPADQIRADVEAEMNKLGLPVDDKNIHVSDVAGNVTISIRYTIPVDLAVYQLQLHFHPQANNASL